MRTLGSGHTAIRADQFEPSGWQLPEIAELSQNNDQGFLANYMSIIAHLHHRPRRTDGNAPSGDNGAATTRSRRPQQMVTSNDNETARSHRTDLLTSSSWFKLDRQMNCTLQNHERDLWTRHRGDQPQEDSTAWNSAEEGAERLRSYTDCDTEGRQRCEVTRRMRDSWESVATHSTEHDGKGSRDDADQSQSARVCSESTGQDRTPILPTRTQEHDDAGHTATEPLLEMLDIHYKLRTQPGRTDAMFELWTRRASMVSTGTWFSESAGAIERRGPGDKSPFDL